MAGQNIFTAGTSAASAYVNSNFYLSNGFGDGSDGAYDDSGNLVQGTVYQYTSFNLSNGETLTTASTSGLPIIIKVQGDCTIAGTIDLDGKGYKAVAGSAGENFQRDTSYGTAATSGSAGGPGSGGTCSVTSYFKFDATLRGIHIDSGQGGGSGVSDGGLGGDGGGTIIFIVGGDFTYSATGVITLDGTGGSAGTGAGGGGGGGAGGHLWVLYRGTLTNSGSTTTTGGSGGAGQSNDGGSGGGASFANNGTAGQAGGSGGAGGDGGAGSSSLQKINSPFHVVTTATI